jgi:hypothetical protein
MTCKGVTYYYVFTVYLMYRDTPTKHKPGSTANPPEKPKVNKREVLQKITCTNDTAKYLSYVKVIILYIKCMNLQVRSSLHLFIMFISQFDLLFSDLFAGILYASSFL